MTRTKTIRAWAGFEDGQIAVEEQWDNFVEVGEEPSRVLAVFRYQKDATKRFEDVREVEITFPAQGTPKRMPARLPRRGACS